VRRIQEVGAAGRRPADEGGSQHYCSSLDCGLPDALQFALSLKQDSSVTLVTWHVQIPGKIITELSVHHVIAADLKGTCVPPG